MFVTDVSTNWAEAVDFRAKLTLKMASARVVDFQGAFLEAFSLRFEDSFFASAVVLICFTFVLMGNVYEIHIVLRL